VAEENIRAIADAGLFRVTVPRHGAASRARIRADTGYAARQITEAIDLLLTAHGAGSFAMSSPLQRIWRDSNTAARHAVVLPPISDEVYGKALLGVENTITPLV
jgi:3-hydroxy-9,10-secoandrosta-1,3,5(10)-triene-9,17-dione monooxygenase